MSNICCTTSTVKVTNPTPNCSNPLNYLIDLVLKQVIVSPIKVTFKQTIDRILNKGIIRPQCGYCCSNCGDLYFFGTPGSLTNLLIYIGVISGSQANTTDGETIVPCCFNYVNAITPTPTIQCENTDFEDCLAHLKEVVGDDYYEALLELGIAELSYFSDNKSVICRLVDILVAEFTDNTIGGNITSATHVFETFQFILGRGIVIQCNPESGEIVIGNYEEWNKYAEATGLGSNNQLD
jgi:hypothetical protein